jgi:UDPglucose--hexose-1-phosphate uridylyltransferase
MSRRPDPRPAAAVAPLPPPAPPNAPGELRQDPLSGDWVAITAGRAARPEAFLGDAGNPRGPLGCPFCPGNEHMTPPEVWADRDRGTDPDRPGWHVRAVPNKFPAFAGPPGPGRPAANARENGGLYRTQPTAGVHEVIVHSTDHQATLADLPEPAVARVMAAWRQRLAAHRDARFGAVLVIVNQGRTAGASLEHPHSQVFATAGRPDRVQAELDRLAGDACAACATVAAERHGPRLVGRAGDLLTLCPWASAAPFEALLLPRRHRPRFEEGGPDDDATMAAALGELLRRFAGVAGTHAPYNLVLHSAPPGVDDFHWHLHLLPRLTTYGGFELGTGVVINVVDPDRAAAALRASGS